MSDRERSAVASYFTAYKGQEKGLAKLSNSNCKHPAMERALSVCESIWEQVCAIKHFRALETVS